MDQERTLDENVLVICDGEKSVGIAGIMGGENSMITDDVKTMLFEAACFDGTNIRLSSKRIGLRTDASAKFEKGLDPNNAEEAINRACQLIEELGAGEVVGGIVDVYPTVKRAGTHSRLSRSASTHCSVPIFPQRRCSDTSKRLTLDMTRRQTRLSRRPSVRICSVPLILQRRWLVSSVMHNIPTTLPTGEATTGKLPFDLRVRAVAQDIAEFCGFSQGMMYSFESPKAFEKLMLPADSPLRNAIKIMNPLGEDFSIMRTQSVNGMLTSLGFNYSHRNKNVRLYELGNIYIPKALPLTELPDERVQFTLGMYGDGDFFTMKGVIEEFLDKLGITGRKSYRPNSGKTFLHPGRQANVYYGDKLLGFLGEVHPLVASAYGIGEKAYIAVLDMPTVTELATFDRKYAGIAKFPAVSRDISMVVPKQILAGEIEDVIIQRGGKILENCQLFDIYEGAQIRSGFKSMAYSITFRAKDRTLEEGDITAAMKKIWNGLEALGIEIRA